MISATTPSGEPSGATPAIAPVRALSAEAEGAVALEERTLDAARLRAVLRLTVVVWAVMSLAYVPIALGREAAALAPFALVHVAVWAALFGALAIAVRPRTTDATLALAALLGFVSPVIGLGVATVLEGQIVSAFGHAPVAFIAGYAMAQPRPVRRSWPWLVGLWRAGRSSSGSG